MIYQHSKVFWVQSNTFNCLLWIIVKFNICNHLAIALYVIACNFYRAKLYYASSSFGFWDIFGMVKLVWIDRKKKRCSTILPFLGGLVEYRLYSVVSSPFGRHIAKVELLFISPMCPRVHKVKKSFVNKS